MWPPARLLHDIVVENRTGDPAFDGTLKKVLEVEISQSPYLNILPDQDMRQTLEYMRRARMNRLDIAQGLGSRWKDLPRAALESLALEAYRSHALTAAQLLS